MPNDPRVKFKKKMYDASRNILYFQGSGTSGRLRSIFEDGTPTDEGGGETGGGGGGTGGGGGGTGGGGTGGGTGGGGFTPREVIPQVEKPTLDPGAISGITIGSIAAAAALTELTRRSIEEERRRLRGMQPVRQLSSRQSGLELTRTRSRVRRIPIQADFAPLSIESSPSSSGTATPFDSARSSGSSTPDLQSARSRSASGASTPSSGELTSFRPNARGFQQQPSALVPAPAPTPAPPKRPNRPLNLQNEIEMRQLEIRMPTTSTGRIKTLQNEINILEEQIRASGTQYTSLEERINLAINTPISRNRIAAQDAEQSASRIINSALAESDRLYSESLIQLTPEERAILESTALFDLNDPNQVRTMTDSQFREFVEREGINIGGPSSGANTPETPKFDRLQSAIENIELKLLDPRMPIERRAKLVAEQKELRSQLAIEEAKLDAFHRASVQRAAASEKLTTSKAAEIRSRNIPKTVTTETPTANNPINDRITAVQPTSELEMTSLGAHEQRLQTALDTTVEVKTRGPTIMERGTAALQKATSRKPAQPKVQVEPTAKPPPLSAATKAAIERARAASGLSTDVELNRLTQQPVETALERAANVTPIIDEGAGLGIGSGRQALGMTDEEFANRLEQAGIQAQREMPFPLDPSPRSKNSEALNRTRQMYEYMREDDERRQIAEAERQSLMETTEAETEFSRQIAEAERQSLMETAPVERPVAAEVPKLPPPPPATARPVATETAVDRFNKIFDTMVEGHRAAGFEIPEAPAGMTGIESKKHIMDEIIRETDRAGNKITEAIDTPKERILTPEEAFAKVQKHYETALNDPTTQRPVEAISAEEHIGTAVPKGKKGKLTRKTDIKATGEQRARQTALTAEAQGRVQSRTTAPREATTTRTTAPEARAAPAEMRTAPEAMSARSVLAPEVSARVPTLTAPEPAGPRVRAQVQSINTTGKPVIEPTGTPGPSPPTSAPGSGTATPQEGATVERTATERASLAEEVSTGLSKKPGRQKARITNGKTKTTTNPLERFVAPEFRNAPNIEIHPGAKTLMSSLSELGSRVPRLVPTRQVLLSAGHTALTEGGGAVAGFFAGSYAGQKMNEYFATHPPKDRGDEFGQALATSMVALGVGNLVSKVVTYVIKQGARVAIGAAITGSIDSAAVAGGTAILEAALFATVATTAQYFTTKSLEDAGYSHEYSRSQGSLAATAALLDLEVAAWLLKGGPVNLYADASFLASELFIIGFGIWSYFEELKEGAEEDRLEAEQREQLAAERAQEIKERNENIARINRTNDLRAAFMIGLESHDYDFDAMYDTLTDEQKTAMGITTPESKASFQRQVESAFDPLGMFAEPPSGLVVPEVLTPLEQQRRDVFNSYINWYIGELRGETQPPFNFNDPKVQELNEYSGGTWQSAAAVSATTSHMQSERVHPLILNAQNTIIDAFHNERKTIEDMPDDVVAYANLDSNFRANYEAYIIADAAAQILIEFNNTQHGYNDVDPALLAIADRDPSFRAAADAYYQTLANQARDFNLPISKIVELNALMENEQAVEIGKLNDARNAIIQKNMAENQAAIDSYNANILKSINIYGDNFEAIIRNINEQSLLSGHTFLYASNKADLYRQLHLEMPELELIDPDDEIKDNALWKPGKGRKVGDTALYGFRHKLTDEQNQELEDMIASGKISRQDEVYQAALIRERDRHLYVETDQERADDLGMSLTDYHAKYGITIDVYDMEIVDYTLNSKQPENGRIRMPDGSIHTYRDGELVNIQSAPAPTIVAYDPALAQQPDGNITMPDGSVRTYKDGRVIEVNYPAGTTAAQALSPAEINAQIDATRGPSYAQLKTMYPEAYERLRLKYAGDPDADAKIESTLTRGHKEGLYYPGGATREDGDPIPEPTEPVKPQPVSTVLFNGEREMPDGTTRSYKDGKVISVKYPAGFPVSNMLDAKGIKALNNSEGLYYDPSPPTPVTPVTPTEPLKNGIVNMPDGSIRTYKNGLIVFVENPGRIGKSVQQMNEEEGVQNATYTGRETTPTTPVTPTAPLQQGLVKMPDGSKRMYIDGKVVSVVYPEGVKGPTLNEINAAEGIKKAEPDSNNPVNPTAPVDPGGLPSQIQTPTQPVTPTQPDREPTYEELQVMYPDKYQTYTRSYADAGKYNIAVPSPAEQAMMIEGLLRAEHTDRTEAGTAAPLPPTTTPTTTPTTNQPLPMVPGAKSYEYADSGTQVAPTPKPTQRPGLDIVPEFVPGARSHKYMPSIVEPQYNAPTTTTNA